MSLIENTKSINGRICYKDFCSKCQKDMGYRRKYDIGRPCRSCSVRQSKIGKPSPRKGVKTGKPAWNAKNITPLQKTIRNRISRRLRHALSGRNLSKNWQDTFLMLGFNVETLMKHLESKFQPGMSWENIGEWHVDHVIPDSWFNYTTINDSDFKKSWSLDNFQPMWKAENISKNNRYSGSYKRKEG